MMVWDYEQTMKALNVQWSLNFNERNGSQWHSTQWHSIQWQSTQWNLHIHWIHYCLKYTFKSRWNIYEWNKLILAILENFPVLTTWKGLQYKFSISGVGTHPGGNTILLRFGTSIYHQSLDIKILSKINTRGQIKLVPKEVRETKLGRSK